MNRKITLILFGLLILLLGLNYGSPLEVQTQPGQRIEVLISSIIVISIFYLLIKNILQLENKILKIIGLGVTALVLIPYLGIGFWSMTPAVLSSNYPIFEDYAEMKNQDGIVIKKQVKRISGSLYDYRNRRLIYDFGNGFRISYLYPNSKINGKWSYHRFASDDGILEQRDTIYLAKFEDGIEKKK
ncbi:hypothetical protein V6B16_14775 [Salinimicrobium catena]|uniref:hypothetical protein n=1 Tax=Salinimicrobium catena TaxID=390640 RepID=UPI002FE4A48B